MPIKVLSRAGLLSLIAAIGVAAGAARADDLAGTQPRPAEVTGAIDARGGTAEPSPVIGRARTALDRFTEARAVMNHVLLLREIAPKSDIAAVQSYMQDLNDNLAAIEQMDPSGAGASAKEARQLAEAWFRAGMQIIAPPANGLTEMPLPMLVKSKAEEVATALDWLVAEATASAAPAPKVAATPPPAFAAAVPPMSAQPMSAPPAAAAHVAAPPPAIPPSAVRAVPTMRPAAHRHAAAPAGPCGPKVGRTGRVRVAQAKPMTQNEASARLFIEGLPLFLPPAALFLEDRDSCRR
jgi:hypothetical protein